MPGPPAAVFVGVCSGHGKCVPAVVHASVPCFGGCPASPKKPVAAMDAYSFWPPAPLVPKAAPLCATVKVNKNVPIVNGDILQEHKSPCSVTVIDLACPKAKNAPTKVSCNTSVFCCSDDAGGIGHQRVAVATSKTVFFEKKNACRVGDTFAIPCLSKITTGSANVLIGP